MSKIETADFTLDSGDPCYGMTVWEAEDGFCTRLVLERPKDSGVFVGLVIHHGPDPEFSAKIPPLYVPADGEMYVGEMLEESHRHRCDISHYVKAKERLNNSTLFTDILKQEEDARAWKTNRSTYGPGGSKERNGYDHAGTIRRWFDERAERTGKRQFPL